MEVYIEVKSFWGAAARSEYTTQGGDALAVILPGQRYSAMAPLLYYSQNIALESGYDTLNIEYGFQRGDKGFENSKESLARLAGEVIETVEKCLEKKAYGELLFIGKSLGTLVQVHLKDEFEEYRQRHIFLTPLPECIGAIKRSDCMVAVGTKDRFLKMEHIDEIAGLKNVKLFVVEGADHRLEEGGYADNLEVLRKVCDGIYGFINGGKQNANK